MLMYILTTMACMIMSHGSPINFSLESEVNSFVGKTADENGIPQSDKGCVIGKDGKIWTKTENPQDLIISSEEAAVILNVMNSQDFTPFKDNGITIGGVTYGFAGTDEDGAIVRGKKDGAGSITIWKSDFVTMIAHVIEGGDKDKVKEEMAKYIHAVDASNLFLGYLF